MELRLLLRALLLVAILRLLAEEGLPHLMLGLLTQLAGALPRYVLSSLALKRWQRAVMWHIWMIFCPHTGLFLNCGPLRQ